MFDNMYDSLEKEYKSELAALKLQWEATKLKFELEKAKHPEMAEQIDNYLNLTKSFVRDLIINDENFDEDDLADYKYVFGEDVE
jgi:hypothetical protein